MRSHFFDPVGHLFFGYHYFFYFYPFIQQPFNDDFIEDLLSELFFVLLDKGRRHTCGHSLKLRGKLCLHLAFDNINAANGNDNIIRGRCRLRFGGRRFRFRFGGRRFRFCFDKRRRRFRFCFDRRRRRFRLHFDRGRLRLGFNGGRFRHTNIGFGGICRFTTGAKNSEKYRNTS